MSHSSTAASPSDSYIPPAQALVRDLVKQGILADEFPVKLDSVAQGLGYQCFYIAGEVAKRIGDEFRGAIDYANKRIFINKEDSEEERRFTFAHEIGHAILHKSMHGAIIDMRNAFSSNETRQKEIEANAFAADLLMERIRFASKFYELCGDQEKLAAYFEVSVSAVNNRIKQLGLDTK